MENNIDLLSVQVLIEGALTPAIVKSLTVCNSINDIAYAQVILNDGSKAKESFQYSDSGDFDPGKKIEILAGYHTREESIFKGLIVNQSIHIDPHDGPAMKLMCKHPAVKTTLSAKNANYQEVKDSDIITKILGQYDFSHTVERTDISYENVLQYHTSDWDFLLQRAQLNGLLVYADEDALKISTPGISGHSCHQITYGDNLIDMDISVNSDNQIAAITANAWNADEQKIISQNSTEPAVNDQGTINGKKLAGVLQQNSIAQTPTALDESALKAWADARLLYTRLARFSGYITCTGTADVKLNALVRLKGTSKTLNGDLLVNSIIHHLEEGQWNTELGVGFKETWYSPNPAGPPGRFSPVTGLQIATVKQIYDDPKERFRVKIVFPLLRDDTEGIWARLNNFYASNAAGAFFYPEVGDEVIVGFLEEDPSAPIILGSMYSKKNACYQAPDEKNSHKTLLTKSKLKLDFDDENKIISLETPEKNTLVISDKDQNITCTDQHNNQIQMNENGITISSETSINIKATNDITMEGQNISLKAGNKITQKAVDADINTDNGLNLKGTNISIKANASLSAQGQASTEIKASGNTSIKGAMVLIN